MSANQGQQTFGEFDPEEISQTEFETDDQLRSDTKDENDVDVHGKIKPGDYIQWDAIDASERAIEIEAVDGPFVIGIAPGGERYKLFPDPQTRNIVHFYGDDGTQRTIQNLWIEARDDA
jgi:hypothetical protein